MKSNTATLANLNIHLHSVSPEYAEQLNYSHPWQPKYVAVEGVDGVGKTTLVENLVKEMREREAEVVVVKEPTPKLTSHLENHPAPTPLWACEAFARDRRNLLDNVVAPALLAGKWVVTDRAVWSSWAYQVGGLGLDQELALKWLLWSIDNVGWPGQTILLNPGENRPATNPDLLANLQGGETYTPDFLTKVQATYQRLAARGMPFCRWISTHHQPTPLMVSNLAEEVFDFQAWATSWGFEIEQQPQIVKRKPPQVAGGVSADQPAVSQASQT